MCHADVLVFFFNDTATTEIYTLSLHDALPICSMPWRRRQGLSSSTRCPISRTPREGWWDWQCAKPSSMPHMAQAHGWSRTDRKSTRLNSSHANISYAVFCLKKKKTSHITHLNI